jgi:hypothetical protein
MLTRVVSGGQTGVDQAGLRAAKTSGIPTGGIAPKHWRTEAGPAPWLGTTFGLTECLSADYGIRTRQNVEAAGATLIVAERIESAGTMLTIRCCDRLNRPFLTVLVGRRAGRIEVLNWPAADAADWIRSCGARTLNCAGHRESGCPGIGEFAERYLTEVFRTLAEGAT